MTDFEKNLTIRIEKAAERTLADKLNAVDWDHLPVNKVVKGTLLALLAWKVGLPLWRTIVFILSVSMYVLAILFFIGLLLIFGWTHQPKTTGVNNPAPRAELVHER